MDHSAMGSMGGCKVSVSYWLTIKLFHVFVDGVLISNRCYGTGTPLMPVSRPCYLLSTMFLCEAAMLATAHGCSRDAVLISSRLQASFPRHGRSSPPPCSPVPASGSSSLWCPLSSSGDSAKNTTDSSSPSTSVTSLLLHPNPALRTLHNPRNHAVHQPWCKY